MNSSKDNLIFTHQDRSNYTRAQIRKFAFFIKNKLKTHNGPIPGRLWLYWIDEFLSGHDDGNGEGGVE